MQPKISPRGGLWSIVLVQCGGEINLNDSCPNVFVYDSDPPCIVKATNTTVNIRQRPVEFLKRLVELFTDPGDWVLDGLSETGKLYNKTVYEISDTFFFIISR